jgi:hypothetical protein
MIHLDLFHDAVKVGEPWRNDRTLIELKVYEGRLEIMMDDFCYQVNGFFRSEGDITALRDALTRYIETGGL